VPEAPSTPVRARGAAASSMLPGAAGFGTPKAAAGRGPVGAAAALAAAAAVDARQAEAEALIKSIPAFASFGPLFKTCDPVR
jgi:hypothetical protein